MSITSASILGDDLTAAVLADRAGVSERHLGRLFLGRGPAEYVRRARTEAARGPHLEQERIPWAAAASVLQSAVTGNDGVEGNS